MNPRDYLISELNTNKSLKPRTRKHYEKLLNDPEYAEKHKMRQIISAEKHLARVIANPEFSGRPWFKRWKELHEESIAICRSNLAVTIIADPLEITWYD